MKTMGLKPTIYAFGLPVPKYIRWPILFVASAIMALAIPTLIIIVIPPVAIAAAIAVGAVLAALKYYFRRRRSRLELQPANPGSEAVVA